MRDLADALFGRPGEGDPADPGPGGGPEVTLVDWDPDGELKVLAAMLYPYTDLPEQTILTRVARMTADERVDIVRKYAGERLNRRHRPGRALERTAYRFDVLSDYGAFRDLQRHRMLTIEWQDLTPSHGYTLPRSVIEAGAAEEFHAAMLRSASLYDALAERFSTSQASYAVALAYRVRYAMHFNAREAMHLLELRTGPEGHPEYRKVCQQMHRAIAEQAGHRALAGLMTFVDHQDHDAGGLERLDAERRAAHRRQAPEAQVTAPRPG
jgi:hypothetical protein